MYYTLIEYLLETLQICKLSVACLPFQQLWGVITGPVVEMTRHNIQFSCSSDDISYSW